MAAVRPDGETRKDRRNQRIVGFGILLIFALLGLNILTGIANYNSQVNHHTATTKQQDEIIKLQKELIVKDNLIHDTQTSNKQFLVDLSTLEQETHTVIDQLPFADAKLVQFAKWLEICVVQHSLNCPAPPIATS